MWARDHGTVGALAPDGSQAPPQARTAPTDRPRPSYTHTPHTTTVGSPLTPQANFCLATLFAVMFLLKLAIFETGIAEIHDMMTFNVPHGLKFIAVSVVLMGCITLYYQAASSFYIVLLAFALIGAFMVNLTNTLTAMGLALPLKAVEAGTN